MPGHFHGVEFGTPRAEAIALLTAYARSLGQNVVLATHGDGVSAGGSVYLESPVWTFGFSFDDYDEVRAHVGMWRKHPAGREQSVAWVAQRVLAYGLPDCVALLAPSESRPVDAHLEWLSATGCTAVTLYSSGDTWDAREDRHSHGWPRTGHVGLREYREQLRRMHGRLAGRPVGAGSVGALLRRMTTWVGERDAVLVSFEPLLPGVGVIDLFDVLAEATRLLDAIDAGLPDSDGSFLVIRAPTEPQTSELRQRLWALTHATGLHATQLTWRPGFGREPTSGELLPPPPDEQVDWVEGPLAAKLLREDLLRSADPGLRCEVVPADFVLVHGAVEQWLPVPPAAESPQSRKYAHVSQTLSPLRLMHPPSGESVYLNHGRSKDELRRYAHALLAARIAARG